MTVDARMPERLGIRDYYRLAAPGIIAGAADIDPTTVATLAVVGSTTVYGLTWLVLLMFPVLAVIQVISAKVGLVSGCDLQRCVARAYGRPSQWVLMAAILVVSVVTVAADLEGGAAALGLLFHVGWEWFVLPLAAALVLLLTLGGYDELQRVLRYVLIGFGGYAVSAVLAHPRWGAVLHASFVPRFHWTSDWTTGALALMGTTLTSYVYVWQTIEESEEAAPLKWLRAREAGASAGILFGVIIFWFILVSTGATLGVHHRPAHTAADAAQALRPIAGAAASDVFAIGLLVSAIVALPVLLATCAYVVGAQFDWERGLSASLRTAPRFYAVLSVAIALGAGIAFTGIEPIRLLFLASIVGGVGTPVGLAYLLLAARNRELMGDERISGWLLAVGWAVTVLVAAASIAALAEQLLG